MKYGIIATTPGRVMRRLKGRVQVSWMELTMSCGSTVSASSATVV